MKTTLRLELPLLKALTPAARVAFALLDRQHAVQRSGELPLSEIAAALPPGRVEAVLHPADSILTSVTVPPLPAHRLAAAVAGAVEPLLLGDVDALAVAHGARGPDGTVAVAWAAREPVARALRLLFEQGLAIDALLPAPLALPVSPAGWTVVQRDEHIVVRSGLQSGYCWAIDPLAEPAADPARTALQLAVEQETPAALDWIAPLPVPRPELPGVQWNELPPNARWQGPGPGWSLALPGLQGGRRGRSPWRRPLVWAAGAAAVWLLGLNVHAWQLKREETALRQRMTAQVKAAFPDIPVVLDPLRQAEQRRDALRAAGGQFGAGDFLPLALATSQLLPEASNNLSELHYATGELRLRLVDSGIGMANKAAAPAPTPAQTVARRFALRREPAQPAATAAPKAEIAPAILQRAQTLGLHVDNKDGEWIIRLASAADGAGSTGGGVRIQQDNQPR